MIWGLANPKTGEREAIEAMLDASSDLLADGQVILADEGFSPGRTSSTSSPRR